MPEVFFVNSNVSHANAAAVCTNLPFYGGGGIQPVMATYHQLMDGFVNSMNVCIDGWVSDRLNKSYYVITNSTDFAGIANDCKGNGGLGTTEWTPAYISAHPELFNPNIIRNAKVYSTSNSGTAGVYCYGTKPGNFNNPVTNTLYNTEIVGNIAKFNKTKYSFNDNIYCLPTCTSLGSNLKLSLIESPSDPTYCITSNCQNTAVLSNNIRNSWMGVCAILQKTSDSFFHTLSNIALVNCNVDNQYNIINDDYSDFVSKIKGWNGGTTRDNSNYTLALPYLTNIENTHRGILNIKDTASNNFQNIIQQSIQVKNLYNGFGCSNYGSSSNDLAAVIAKYTP